MRLQLDVAIARAQRRFQALAGPYSGRSTFPATMRILPLKISASNAADRLRDTPSAIVPLTLSAAMLPPDASPVTVNAVSPDTLFALDCDT